MRVVIIGCGKLGAGLALELYKRGNTISIIDKDPEAFYRLGSDFNGNCVIGNGYDKKVLEDAEIEYADALVCATGNDEINAVAAKIGKDTYFIKHVIARLYNPKKAKVFEALGIKTVSTTGYMISRAIELLSYNMMDSVALLGKDLSGEIVRITASMNIDGYLVSDIDLENEFKVIAILRDSQSIIVNQDSVIKKGDILYIVTKTDSKRKLKIALGI